MGDSSIYNWLFILKISYIYSVCSPVCYKYKYTYVLHYNADMLYHWSVFTCVNIVKKSPKKLLWHDNLFMYMYIIESHESIKQHSYHGKFQFYILHFEQEFIRMIKKLHEIISIYVFTKSQRYMCIRFMWRRLHLK